MIWSPHHKVHQNCYARDHTSKRQGKLATILPRTCKYVAVTITGFLSIRYPQKYSPESNKSTCLIFRKIVEMLVLISNFPFVNPSQSEAGIRGLNICETHWGFVLLTSLNQNIWVTELEKLEHRSVTSPPRWTSRVWDSVAETENQPETHRKC